MTREEAKDDILLYLKSQDDEYFSERGRTREEVLQSEEIVGTLVDEHMRCVTRYGVDREWSCKDACDCDPGFRAENVQ